MRWLFVSNDFPSRSRPEKAPFNAAMVRGLGQHHDVDVICPVPWTERFAVRSDESEQMPREFGGRVTAVYPTYYYTPRCLRRCYTTFMHRSISRAVASVLARGRPDVVLGYWAHPDGDVATRIAHGIGAPSLVMVGGSDVLLLTRQSSRRRLVVDALRRADRVIATSAHLRARLLELGIQQDRIVVLRRGVDTALFSPGDRDRARRRLGLPSGAPILVWAGRLEPVKGLDVLLKALERVNATHPGASLHLIGDGRLRDALSHQAQSLGLAASCIFHGVRPHSALPDWFRAADAVVLSSYSEGTPNVLLEAAACGTRFVATAVGGVSAIADARYDVLVPPGDPRALAEGICALLRTPVPAQWSRPVISLEDATRQLADVAGAARATYAQPLTIQEPACA